MKSPLFPSLAALILLTSCSQSEPDPAPETPDAGPAEAVNPEPAPKQAAAETEKADAERSIPKPFQGVWDYVKGSCAPESDLRIEISPDVVVFYESLGTVKSVEQIDDTTIAVELAMEGEGETWDITNRFALINDGSGLSLSDAPDGGGFDPLELKRCD